MIRVGGAISDLVWAVRGIVAGSGLATTGMRLVMIDIVDQASLAHPDVTPTLFVDDLSSEQNGGHDFIKKELGGFTRHVVIRIHEDCMEVSGTKSMVSASHPSLAEALQSQLQQFRIPSVLRVKSLGVGLAAGVARNTQVMQARLKNFTKRIPRFKMLKRAGVDTAMLVRTGGLAALMHGFGSSGVSPSVLLHQRRAVQSATAPKSGLGGQEMEVAMMIADGTKTGRADPAFPAHIDVVQHWAQAIWNKWLPVESLQTSLDYALLRTTESKRPWSVVTGPAAALALILERVGWTVHDATNITTDTGRDIELGTDPPILVARLMQAAVRRWRWSNFAEAHPSTKKDGAQLEAG